MEYYSIYNIKSHTEVIKGDYEMSSEYYDNYPLFSIPGLRERNAVGTCIFKARRKMKMSQKDLASRLGEYGSAISAGAVSKWEKGEALPNALQFLALCDILHIRDIHRYFTGTVPDTDDMRYSFMLNSEGQRLVDAITDALVASGLYSGRDTYCGRTADRRRTTGMGEMIPMRDMRISMNRVSAGTGNFLDDDQFEVMQFPVSQIPGHADFGIRITGDSMMPYYCDGQIVWVERCRELNPGEVGIFIYDGEGYVKQYREEMPGDDELADYIYDGTVRPKIWLRSFNSDYPDKPVEPGCRFEIIGRVLN